ncbi:MAG: hydroxysqualene dehydroxylase HpnE [gamma proteobacterium symbiont of Lucinoma myriamae]|nr:hydroxysqualene dehydroxylase HpnE [gamma proteobacterium symbiont of Lucinoma myriamae]MCU7818024.1 hydroxysqualene dehydroxylase HpnE [gamma proteobacterium symbiont of Lucinoma myriamae]MCU7833078.1 hydroxysqualene dehydroxylase HpnE [gamma proteobacterium symbiont of Lucinoma myriamae]
MPIPASIQHQDNKSVIIVGGGWSGLACAITLANQGIKVHLLESARQLGGRACRIQFKNFLSGQNIDNGQHIMLGAYHSTLSLFKLLGIDEADIIERQPLDLNLFSPSHSSIRLKAPTLPAPFHLFFALMNIQGLPLNERISAIKMSLKLAVNHFSLKQDLSVSELLKKHQQSPIVIQTLWEPLCLATMNTPSQYASAQVFLNTLKDSFSRNRKDSDLLFFKNNLSAIFSDPALEFISQHKGQVNCAAKVIELNIRSSENHLLSSENPIYDFMITTADTSYQSHTVVLATPPHISEQLLHSKNNLSILEKKSFLKPENASLNFNYEPIYTVYMQYPPSVKLPSKMVGFFDTIGQWAIDRSLCRQDGLIAMVISGSGKHTQIPHNQLADLIHKELKVCIPDIPECLDFRIITEHRATFSCSVNIEQQRPQNSTIIPGLYLAGDYTNTRYPATLEGAIKSGINAAKQIINRNAS